MQTPDLTLFERWRSGRDAEAFQELAHRHAGMVYGACKRVLRNEHDAEEVAQDCFARLVRGDVAPPNRSFGAWLHRFATHRAIDRLRSETSRHARETAYAKDESVVEYPEWNDIREHVDEAIAALPDKLREPVVLHFLEGRTHQEVADAVQVPRPTVTRRISQGVERVRKSLTRKGVTLASGTLAVLLRANAAQAASPALLGELGKMALAGGGSAAAGATAATAVGGLLTLKTALIAAGTVAVVVATAVVLNKPPASHSAQVPESVSPVTAIEPDREEVISTSVSEDSANESFISEDNPQRPTQYNGGIIDLKLAGSAVISGVALRPGATQAIRGPQLRIAVWPKSETGARYYDAGIDGSFRIIHVPSGTEMLLWASNLPGDMLSQRVSVKVPPEGNDKVTLKLAPAGTITGRFADKANRPIPRASIEVVADADWYMTRRGTDERGQFEIQVAPGRYSLTAAPRDNTATEAGPIQVAVAARQTVSGVNLVFDGRIRPIAGTVVDQSGQPLMHASIAIRGIEAKHGERIGTDGLGRFETAVSLDMPHTVQASKDGFAISDTRIARPGDENVNFFLTPAGEIAGQVVHAMTGEPVTAFRVRVEVQRRDDTEPPITGHQFINVENAEGRFAGVVRIPGDATITVRAPGFREATHRVPNVMPPQEVTDIVVALNPAQTLRGRLVDSEGQPVEDANIYRVTAASNRRSPDTSLSWRSNRQGRFAIDALLPENTHILVHHDDFIPEAFEVPRQSRNGQEYVFRLDAGATISGQVKEGPTPLAGRTVELSMSFPSERLQRSDHVSRRTETDAEGYYVFKGLPEGQARVSVLDNHYRRMPGIYKQVSVPSGGSLVADMILATGNAAVEGIVTLAGAAVLRTQVSLVHQDDAVSKYNTQTNGEGRYSLEGLPPGEARAVVSAGSNPERRITVPVQLEDGKTIRADAHFVKADAALEGAVDTRGWAFGGVWGFLSINTGVGFEEVYLMTDDCTQGFYLVENLPPGRATLKLSNTIAPASPGQSTYEFELRAGSVTRQDIVVHNNTE